MPNYRRYRIEGGTYFFTVKTEKNAPIFRCARTVSLFGTILRKARRRWPFDVNAMVLLPDHLHAIWSLPPGDAGYSLRWAWVKKEFTKRYLATAGASESWRSSSRLKNRRRGVWQRRFWEHTITDESDFNAYFDYIHWNPAKHGYVKSPVDWPHSTFHRWVREGVYEQQWGADGREPVSIVDLENLGE